VAQAAQSAGPDDALLRVENLQMYFPIRTGIVLQRHTGDIKAVDGVSFSIRRGETLGLVGESGCGKTTTGRAILQLYRPTGGHVYFEGQDVTQIRDKSLRDMRRTMQMIFQDPYSSLNPRMTVSSIVGEPLRYHHIVERGQVQARINELLTMVGLNPYFAVRYPHEFSGGQRQRIGIARALSVEPSFIVCDEPISSLDVSIQAQIINLLEELQAELDLTYLFIAHDLAVVRHISDHIAVMYLGKIVEISASGELYENALHPYTTALLSAVPVPDPQVEKRRQRIVLQGDVPSPANPPPGCNFCTRCPVVMDQCHSEEPELIDVGGGHQVACWRVGP
jgi:oligopeptide transport system ATP-binding protein